MAFFQHSALPGGKSLLQDLTPPAPRYKESVLFSVLPSVAQNRLPRLLSIRRSLSTYGLVGRRKSQIGTPKSDSGAYTPEAGYTSTMVLSSSPATGDDSSTEYSVEGALSYEDSPRQVTGEYRRMELTESATGIEWKFANQGLGLLSLAVQESSNIAPEHGCGNAGLARQLYIHALTYLLRALPADLTTEERVSVRGALPSGVVEPLRVEIHPDYNQSAQLPGTCQPSILHRTLSSTIIQLFVFLQFILPYLKYLLQSAYQYERQHRISEKVLSQGIETVDVIGKQGLSLTGTICEMGDGKVGQLITEAATWVVEGVTGGIHEGVGEGMAIMGAKRSHAVERK